MKYSSCKRCHMIAEASLLRTSGSLVKKFRLGHFFSRSSRSKSTIPQHILNSSNTRWPTHPEEHQEEAETVEDVADSEHVEVVIAVDEEALEAVVVVEEVSFFLAMLNGSRNCQLRISHCLCSRRID